MATPEEQAATMRASIKEKTGKTIAQWKRVVAKSKLDKHSLIVKLLKTEHGVTHGYANFVAHELRAAETTDKGTKSGKSSDPIAKQYEGAKADLRPIYDALLAAALKLGADVEVAPKKQYVSLRRKKQFAIIQPSTKTRVDLGLNLKGTEPTERLEISGSFNGMVSHRVRLESKRDVNAAVRKWLKAAYTAAG